MIHSSAHNDLETAGEPMSKGMKITNFCNGLKDAIAINNAITTMSEPAALLSFDAFYNSFFAKLLSHLTLVNASSLLSSHTINSVQHGRWGRGGSGRGRGRGHGRYNPYNGHGQGRGHGRGMGGRSGKGDFSSNSTSWHPKARDYPDEEWYSLTFNQQQRVRDLCRAVGHRNPHGGNDQNNQHERQINATEMGQASIPGEVSIGGNSIPSQAGHAGDVFAPRQQGSNGSRNARSDGGGSSC